MVVGQVHELVDQVRLVKVAGERAELLVGGQAVTAGGRGGVNVWHRRKSKNSHSGDIRLTRQGFSPDLLPGTPRYPLTLRASPCLQR